MPYLIDRARALPTRELVAVLAMRRRRVRSRLVLRDNSLHETLTRPKTLMRYVNDERAQLLARRNGVARGRANS